MSFLPIALAIAPFILFFIFLFGFKTKLVWTSLFSFVLTGAVALFYWKIYPSFLIGSLEKGFFVAFDIFLIILGAIFFLEILKEIKIFENIGIYLRLISKDVRVQVILLAWFLENFLEGTAGFGTPGAIVAPLLIGLGISPINAVIIALLGNSTAGIFGAAGTPIKIGFGELVGASLPLKAALLNFVGILIPVFILWFLTKNKEDGRKSFFEALPFAIWSGVVFVVFSALTVFLGQEFPSILGSVLGLVVILISLKIGLFVPKENSNFINNQEVQVKMPLRKIVFPYAFLITLLIIGKLFLGNEGIIIPLVVKHTFAFFNPGFAFLIAGIVVSIIYKIPKKIFNRSSKLALTKSVSPFLIIIFMSSMAQIMVNSVQNLSKIPSMIDFLAMSVKNTLLPLLSPLVGALGSFITGSVTISNIMFGNFLAVAAKDLNFDIDGILALTLVGGAIGNMIALADILVAETVVGLKHREREVIKGVIIPCMITLVLLGIVGLIVF